MIKKDKNGIMKTNLLLSSQELCPGSGNLKYMKLTLGHMFLKHISPKLCTR